MDRPHDREAARRSTSPSTHGDGHHELDLMPDDEPERQEARPCPICLRRLPVDSPTCVVCRFDPRLGLQPETIVGGAALGERGLVCVGCGHSLRGAMAPRCPECGRSAVRGGAARRSAEDAAIATHEHMRVPLIASAIGLALLFVIIALFGSLAAAAATVVSIVIFVPVCATVLKIAAVFGLEIDGTWLLTTIQVATVTVLVALTGLVAMALLPDLFALIVTILIATAVTAQLFELDGRSALMLSAIIAILFVATQFTLAWLWPGFFLV